MTPGTRCLRWAFGLGLISTACSTTAPVSTPPPDAGHDAAGPARDASSNLYDSTTSSSFADAATTANLDAASDLGEAIPDAGMLPAVDAVVPEDARDAEASVPLEAQAEAEAGPSECPELPSPQAGSVSAPSRAIGAVATYSCDVGYTGSGGAAKRTCMPTGTWSDLPAVCSPIQCPGPTPPASGTVAVTALTFGSTASYVCQAGTCLTGSPKRTCQADGTWSGAAPTCAAGDCPVPAAPPPSCLGGGPGAGNDCGPKASDNCCSSPVVDAGSFHRTNNAKYPATVSRYRLDKYEVTVGRFRAFVNAGKGIRSAAPAAGAGANPHVPNSGWDPTWNDYLLSSSSEFDTALKCASGAYQTWSAGDDHRAINCVTWIEAMAFCIWDGGRLESELEWNYAAAGGSEERLYPWGSNEPGTDNSLAIYGCNYKSPAPMQCQGFVNIPAVGIAPLGNGRWGHADLAGGMWEFGLDLYSSTLPGTCADCANITTGASRVELGGAYGSPIIDLRTTSRFRAYNDPLNNRSSATGMRCAREP